LRKKGQNEYLILPSNSIFGDYQIIFNYRATECYTSDESQDTYCMCLKKKKFLKILEKYPEADTYFRERARERRIEFKRIKKLFLLETGVQDDSDDEGA